jgi:TetR/AcrR family transcriptional regulator
MTASQLQARRRAVAPQHKAEKRAVIVRAAEALARRDPSASCSVEQLARKAGLAKGTVYLYFRTREEVLLAVHEKQTHAIFDVVEGALDAKGADADRVVRTGLRYLRSHPEFFPLAGNCRYMLDTNVSTEAALAFKGGLAQRLEGLGRKIERLYPGLKPGEGAALLTNSYALIVGLWQQADVPLCLRAVMHRPELRIFKIDFEQQLADALLDLWEAAGRRRKGARP